MPARTKTALAVGLAVVVVAALTTVGFAAEHQAATGHILFTRAGGMFGDETLFVANADGTGERRLSRLGSTCCPWATRDGSRIVFGGSGRGGRITAVIARLDGSHRVVLPLPRGTLSLGSGPLSPSGKLIAREGFDDNHPGAAGIYLTRVSDGTVVRRVTRTHFIPGDFSPDGKKLVLFKGPDGEPPPAGSLWIVNVNGKGLRRLTPANVQVECCNNYRWSPDGRAVVFADSGGVLWTIAPDGSNLTQRFKDANGGYAITPSWSPDGSALIFALDPTPNPFDHPVNGLYVVNLDGSGLTKLIGGNDFKREPVWVSGQRNGEPTKADHMIVDRAYWVPTVNSHPPAFVSRRLRNYQYNPIWDFVATQAWLA